MATTSAGILMYRRAIDGPLLLLVHPGGPYWSRRDDGAWSIPKGEIGPGEEPAAAAVREFEEELGVAPQGKLWSLGQVRQRGGKLVIAFAVEGDFEPAQLRSNTFEMEWPPRSGRLQRFPEVDRAAWFSLSQAREKILPAQVPLIERLWHVLVNEDQL
ncbi:NUDIX hydrolase [Bordetella genomosp. 9]|uniref:NUDIX domain-containing protein n=1 Tax=Bordetella genomosp. 9 TaxID=1416803 RepID=UPI000A28FBAF|nr:NUDIX domain-containing protein [Bordetella genomosp. 9]ARP89965.1 NUDIX hydrolase [Bordetella genomosp. 9]